tara:strand:- start:721 stop:1266 length:546 start_codon:yes stop_codon:yes gene_type:complete
MAFILSGCMDNPMPMGRGYSSYKEPYKSVKGAEARDIGYDFTVMKNDQIMDSFRYIARDLVDQLDHKVSFGVDEIYLATPAHTAFYNSFDHVLRDELTHRGYLLANSPEDALRIEFVAREDIPACMMSDVDDAYQKYYIALAIDVVNKVPSDMVGGFYVAPSYDYKPAGILKFDIPACEGE